MYVCMSQLHLAISLRQSFLVYRPLPLDENLDAYLAK